MLGLILQMGTFCANQHIGRLQPGNQIVNLIHHYPKESAWKMESTRLDLRANRRYFHDTPILYEHYPSGKYFEGRMLNYSRGGLYFESDHAPQIGSEIFIGVENSPFTSGHEVYRTMVIWQTKLENAESFFLYGTGVKYF
jgi:hypothetical protein